MTIQVSIASSRLPTNRKFGWFFAAVFSALGAYAYWKAWGGGIYSCAYPQCPLCSCHINRSSAARSTQSALVWLGAAAWKDSEPHCVGRYLFCAYHADISNHATVWAR